MWPEEKVLIDFKHFLALIFVLKFVGHGDAYIKHIQQETRCLVQIKGCGSGFLEHGTGLENNENMYFHIA